MAALGRILAATPLYRAPQAAATARPSATFPGEAVIPGGAPGASVLSR